jgi:DNA excision repair protein ERCC-6
LLEGEGDDGEQAKGPAKKVQLIEDMDLFGDSEEGEEELEGGSGKGGVTHPLMETERDRMIRQGLITPFGSLSGYEKRAAGGAVGARTGLARIGAAAGLGPGKAGAPKGAAKPFDRAPIADLMEREGRAGKPLAQLMEEASSKSKQAVAARHATQVMDAEQAIDEVGGWCE